MGVKVSTSELKMVARSMGWAGKGVSKDEVMAWLRSRNMDAVQIAQKVSELRRAISGQGSSGGSGMSKSQIEQIIADKMSNMPAPTSPLDMKAVEALVAAAVAKAAPGKIIIEPGKPTVVLKERTHPIFEKVLRLVKAGVNVMLVGPAGCGKTFLGHQLGRAMKRKFGALPCTAGSSESQLIGWLLPTGKQGAFEYTASEFVTLWEGGDSLFLLDEIDGADANMLMVLNAALANGILHIPQRYRKPHVERGKNAAIIAAANTFGSGADAIYVGRNQLDAATLDRFYIVRMDYDRQLEAEMAPPEICEWAWTLRDKVQSSRLRRVVSTRMIQKLSLASQAGIPLAEAKRDMFHGWTADELAKVGETV